MNSKQKPKQITTLGEIRAQLEYDIIEIPGFKPGTFINVKVKPVDVTPELLQAGMGNPLLTAAANKAKEGKSKAEIERELTNNVNDNNVSNFSDMMPLIDAVVKEALVEPTWEEIHSVHAITLAQKMAISDYALGALNRLTSFRS